MVDPVRRIVTGHDERGRAVVVSDEPARNVYEPPNRPGVGSSNLWVMDAVPTDPHGDSDPTRGTIALPPPTGGVTFRIVELSPEKNWIDDLDRATARASFAAAGGDAVADPSDDPPHPLMHRTQSVDFAIVLEGECDLVLDDSEVHVRAGDVVVQRATNHAWANRSERPCKIAFVLVSAEPSASAPTATRSETAAR